MLPPRTPTDGQLRQVDAETGVTSDQPYEFAVRPKDAAYNQLRYEALGEVITEHVYDLLIAAGLQRISVPGDMPDNEATFVFANRADFTRSRKLLILINGSGVVRAGQWARSLIINQSLNHGTQLPYIKRALSLDYDVLVMNTNDNHRQGRPIPHSGNAAAHAIHVWEQLVSKSPARVAIVAHSFGGEVSVRLALKFPEEFCRRVFAIGLTDTVHGSMSVQTAVAQHYVRSARNWVSSKLPLNEPVLTNGHGIPEFSAGHARHEWTSWACIEPLFEFLEAKYRVVGVADAVPVVEAGAAADAAEAAEEALQEEEEPEKKSSLPTSDDLPVSKKLKTEL